MFVRRILSAVRWHTIFDVEKKKLAIPDFECVTNMFQYNIINQPTPSAHRFLWHITNTREDMRSDFRRRCFILIHYFTSLSGTDLNKTPFRSFESDNATLCLHFDLWASNLPYCECNATTKRLYFIDTNQIHRRCNVDFLFSDRNCRCWYSEKNV